MKNVLAAGLLAIALAGCGSGSTDSAAPAAAAEVKKCEKDACQTENIPVDSTSESSSASAAK